MHSVLDCVTDSMTPIPDSARQNHAQQNGLVGTAYRES